MDSSSPRRTADPGRDAVKDLGSAVNPSTLSAPTRTRERHLSQEAADMRALFSTLDKDHNGYIDKNELRLTMAEVGLELSPRDIDTMMKAAGVVIKDRIFYEDFVQMMTGKIGQSQRKALLKSASRSSDAPSTYSLCDGEEEPADIQGMRVAFSTFDHDGDGLIREQEVHDTMTSLGIKVSLNEVKKIVRKVDTDGTGAISFDKFLAVMNRHRGQTDGAGAVRCFGGRVTSGTRFGRERMGRNPMNRAVSAPVAAGIGMGGQFTQADLVDAAFRVFDKDHDGFLNADDLKSTMQQIGLVLSDVDVHSMMKSVGVGPHGKISYTDFCQIYQSKAGSDPQTRQYVVNSYDSNITQQQIKELRAVFDVFDIDRDGFVTTDEVVQLLVSMGFTPSRDHIVTVFQQVDLDGNGKIDFDEFRLLVAKYERPLPENVELREMFKALDKDRNGVVEPDELKESFAELGVPLTDDDVAEMMREADVQGNKIYYDDFVQIMSNQLSGHESTFNSTSNGPSRSYRESLQVHENIFASSTPSTAQSPSKIRTKNSTKNGTSPGREASSRSPSGGRGDKGRDSRRVSSDSSGRDADDGGDVLTSLPSSAHARGGVVVDRADVIDAMPGDLERAILASIEAASRTDNRRRERLKMTTSKKSLEVRDFFRESLSTSDSSTPSRLLHAQLDTQTVQTVTSSSCSADSITRSQSNTSSEAPNTWIAFKVFDRNSDGYISKTELHRTMTELGIPLSEHDLDVMMSEADVNKDGRIDYAEFSKLMNGSFENYANQAAKVQLGRDTASSTTHNNHSNGTVRSGLGAPSATVSSSPHSTSPLREAPSRPAKTSPRQPPTSDTTKVSQSTSRTDSRDQAWNHQSRAEGYEARAGGGYELRGGGSRDMPGWGRDAAGGGHDAPGGVKEEEGVLMSPIDENEMRASFRVFDIDGDGLIDAEELRQTMMHLGETLSDDDVTAMINVVDKNDDGKVDYEEFIQLMRFSK